MSTSDIDQAYRTFDAIDAGLIVLDGLGLVRGWNAWIAQASRVSAEVALGKSLAEALPVAPPRRLMAATEQALGAGASSLLTHTLHARMFDLMSRSGMPILHNVAVLPFGEPGSGCLIQITDVTASTNREALLRERQNARYNAVVNGAMDAILTIDAAGLVQWMNRAGEQVFGYPSAMIVGRPVSLVLGTTGSLPDALALLDRGIEGGRAIETTALTRTGSRIHVEFSAARWEGQGRSYVTVILRDIGERKASEQALLKLNESLESLVADRTADRDRMWRLSSDMMLIANLDGKLAACNPAATTVLGWSELKLLGSNMRDLIANEDLDRWDAEIAAMRADGASHRIEVRVKTAHRTERWIEWSAAIADDFLQAVGRDITAEKQAAATLQNVEQALRQSQKMEAIGQLTGGIAHDFNNLLAGVIGGLEIVKRRVQAGRYEDLNRFMEASINSAQRAAALTHRLLAFSRQQPLDPKPYDVNEIITGMEELMRRSLGEQVRLTFRLEQGLGLAATDANQLENAILNLVINARDAMPQGGDVRIRTALANADEMARLRGEGLEAEAYLVVSVSDTGEGMPPEVIAKAFDPFFTTKAIGKGTGLGLSMTYGFVKQSHGHIEIASEIGRGTEVTLYLPQSVQQAGAGETAPLERAPQGSGETVLVVEDDAAVRMLVADVLHELGYTAIEVSDSRAALPVIQSDARLDLMISDVGLPGIDGRKLAEIAREHRPNLRILFVTGYAQHAKVRDDFLGPGMDMLTKPFALDALGHKIKAMLS